MSQSGNLRAIIQSSAIVGGASLAVMAIGLARSKGIALLTGPAGIGSMGLFNSLITLVAAIGALGIGTAAINEVAEAKDDRERAIRSVWLLAALLAAASAIAVRLFGQWVIEAFDGDRALVPLLWWLAVGVGLSILVLAQNAIIVGARRFRTLAAVQIVGTFLGAAVGVGLVAAFGMAGIVGAVVAAPAATFAVGAFLIHRARDRNLAVSRTDMAQSWGRLARLGVPVMAASIISFSVQFGMRSVVFAELGLTQTGLFQAALTITTINMGLVLAALGADFLPRLSAAKSTGQDLSHLASEQMAVVCLLSAPIIIALAWCAPLVLTLLYTADFTGAQSLLRWQMLGEVFRLPSFILGYVLIARRDSLAYLAQEITNALALPLTWLLLPRLGLEGAGIAYAAVYALCLLLTAVLVGRRHGVWLGQPTILILAMLAVNVAATLVLGSSYPVAMSIAGLLAASGLGLWALRWMWRHDLLPRAIQDRFRKRQSPF